MLDEALFRDALLREGRRADRFEEPFVLLRLSLRRGAHLDADLASRWPRILQTLAETRHDTDIVGWIEHGVSMGLIRLHLGADARTTAAGLGVTAEQQLARGLERDAGFGCVVQVEVIASHTDAHMALAEAGALGTDGERDKVRDGLKRALDVAGSAALLSLLSPVFLVTAVAVRLTSKGPVFFRQERIGQNAKPFTMLKFRTMRVDADPTLHQQYVSQFITSGATSQSAGASAPVFKIVNDPRITSIGHFLRRSSLDELPQFWNVLKGDMSLVGPRPPLPYEVQCYKRWHWRRVLDAKPGITGLWQVTGRSRTTFDEMVRLDIRYAQTHSLLTDLKILLATPRAVMSGKGAH